jgi:CubicO group peptidase (beta-lactamase class C family)
LYAIFRVFARVAGFADKPMIRKLIHRCLGVCAMLWACAAAAQAPEVQQLGMDTPADKSFMVQAASAQTAAQPTTGQASVTGVANPAFAGVDAAITAWMNTYSIPGGTVAIAYNGNIVYSRGYGFANATTSLPAQPDNLFRVASLSKAITAAAILRLVDSGKLKLDDKAMTYLAPDLGGATLADSRIQNITIRQLLHLTNGINRTLSSDPPGAVVTVGNTIYKTCRDRIVQDLPTRILDFDPGTQFGYNDYAYCMLSRVIERVSGFTYEQFVSRNLLSPLGIATSHAGDTLANVTGYPEAFYSDKLSVGLVPPLPGIFPGPAPAFVQRPYGAFYLEGYAGSAVWVMSAPDYLRFLLGYKGMRQPALLSAATQPLIYEQPAAPMPQVTDPLDTSDSWYGLGLYVRQNGGGYNTWHDGWLYGTRTYGESYSTGIAWVTLFNSTPETFYTQNSTAVSELDNAVATALAVSYNTQLAAWPTADVVPAAPVPPQSGWWWNPAEGGRGYAVEMRGGKMFFATFLYNDDGSARWLASNGLMTNSMSYQGTLTQYAGGQTLGGSYTAITSTSAVGGITLSFTSPTTATLNLPGAAASTPLQRFSFVTNGVTTGPAASMPETGWWWNPAEGGRGFYAEVQGNTLLFSGYMYNTNGQAVWYVSQGSMQSPSTYQGELTEYAGGETLTGPYKSPTTSIDRGPITLQFNDQQNAVLTLPNGNQIPLTRFRF